MPSFSTLVKIALLVALWVLGWLSPLAQRQSASAQATLFFPAARVVDWREHEQGAGSAFSEPRDWARSVLNSGSLAESVRQQLGAGAPAEVLASCSLLTEESRLQVSTEEPGLLRVTVQADGGETARQLCEGVLDYLQKSLVKYREESIKLGLARMTEQQASVLDRQESAEKELVKQVREHQQRPPSEESSLWGLGGDKKDPVEFGTRGDYVSGLAASRRLKAQELKLALQEETALPGFSVVDAPHIMPQTVPLWQHGLGLAGGLVLSGLLVWSQTRRRKS